MRSRRATATLSLVLIGAAALQGCGDSDEDTASRDVYGTRADCQRDWGDDAKKCEQQTSGTHSGFFYGPLMYGLGRSTMGAGSSMSAPRSGSNAVGSTNVTRGGFGSSGSAHSSGS